MGRLDGKRVVISGTSSGMGKIAAQRFTQEGARVVGCGRDVGRSEETAKIVREQGGDFVSKAPVDLTVPAQVKEWIDWAADHLGGIDILYNNAGEPKFGPIGEMSDDDYLFTVRNEMDQYFYSTTAAWPYLVKSGNAAIVNTGSISGLIGVRTLPQTAHAMTKAGIIGMTHQLAAEGARHGIRANTVSPGLIYTPATSPFVDLGDKGPLAQLLSQLPMGRPGRPEEIVNAALFLASDEASYITGQNLVVDGGVTVVK